ncbi:acyl-CoA carboxylase subunit epsilon [Streptomyces sp. NBC_00199]|uniref:acyl-CoA carboxylase subunit epsilon n=1 Tax=Streptomyces sp. NBC_00199 TaxID=2975678 RepID=UPI002255C0C9|nr:acyl-CoA carboxylase subunit epsilon [Streptomyces sp. NBC_00199]MCX5266371.1 acyl-CoA carboxylase subunit epsilon [Streptomyces sp. NBC_00199]
MSAAPGVPSPSDALREAAFRVVRGNPDPDELAALACVLTVLRARAESGAGDAAGPAAVRANWDRAGHGYRGPLAWVG